MQVVVAEDVEIQDQLEQVALEVEVLVLLLRQIMVLLDLQIQEEVVAEVLKMHHLLQTLLLMEVLVVKAS
jgi:hypothetical protein